MPQGTISRPVISSTMWERKKQVWQITMSGEIKQLTPTVVCWLMLTLDGTQHGLASAHIKWLFLCWQKCKQYLISNTLVLHQKMKIPNKRKMSRNCFKVQHKLQGSTHPELQVCNSSYKPWNGQPLKQFWCKINCFSTRMWSILFCCVFKGDWF